MRSLRQSVFGRRWLSAPHSGNARNPGSVCLSPRPMLISEHAYSFFSLHSRFFFFFSIVKKKTEEKHCLWIKPTRYLLSVHSHCPIIFLVPSSMEYRSQIPNLFYCQLSAMSWMRNGYFVKPIHTLLLLHLVGSETLECFFFVCLFVFLLGAGAFVALALWNLLWQQTYWKPFWKEST